ncbi:MAG: redoxin domain-containing protein [Rubrobacteraceae bacterium]|jgi:peroxiredoxin|nr:redoxin domain-containing protein [Actinomycetota bacterium]
MSADVGERAPDFALPSDSWDEKVSLKSYVDTGPVVLFFYPGDWSSVCTDQLSRVQAEISRFEEKGARVLAISADTPWSHRAWAEERGIEFPLLSDLEREAVDSYGVRHEDGYPERAYFVIDREGVIRAKQIEASTKDQPDVEAVLEDLEKAL